MPSQVATLALLLFIFDDIDALQLGSLENRKIELYSRFKQKVRLPDLFQPSFMYKFDPSPESQYGFTCRLPMGRPMKKMPERVFT